MTEFSNLAGQIAVVTGASSGIGHAIALEFARAGADLIIHYAKSAGPAKNLAATIQSLGRRAHLIQADYTDTNTPIRFVDEAWSVFGGVDIWVNNAGADLLTGDAANWPFEQKLDQLIDVDIRASILTAKYAGEKMVAQAGGVILTIGWDQADRGMEGNSGELFAASKNAMMGFSRSLAVSLAPHVRVNCIAPGWIKTAWGDSAGKIWQERVLRETPLKRWGLPEDIARVARFLCSSDASFVTGQVINVNGGAIR